MFSLTFSNVVFVFYRKDEKEYALKQIEGTGISMSACREIAVSYLNAMFLTTLLTIIFHQPSVFKSKNNTYSLLT